MFSIVVLVCEQTNLKSLKAEPDPSQHGHNTKEET